MYIYLFIYLYIYLSIYLSIYIYIYIGLTRGTLLSYAYLYLGGFIDINTGGDNLITETKKQSPNTGARANNTLHK